MKNVRMAIFAGFCDAWRDITRFTCISLGLLLLLSVFTQVGFLSLIVDFFRPLWACFTLTKPDFGEIAQVLITAAPLWLTAIAFTLPMKGGFFNIGAEGQMLMSSFTAIALLAWIGKLIPASFAHLTQMLAVTLALIIGGLWALVPLMLRRLSGVNEVITGLVLNYLAAVIIVLMLSVTGLADPSGQGIYTRQVSNHLKASALWSGTQPATIFLPLSILIVLLFQYWLTRTRAGLCLRAVGINRKASDLLGIRRERIVIGCIAAAGCCAGMAGMNDTLGAGRFSLDNLRDFGFEGILVAILASHSASGIFTASIFIAMWRHFAVALQLAGLSPESYLSAQALFLLFYLIRHRRSQL